MMSEFMCFRVLSFLCLSQYVLLSQANFQCGIRQHGIRPLIGSGWQVEKGHWPWHVAVFKRNDKSEKFEYCCGGTLVNEKHVLTAAHCVVKQHSKYSLPALFYEIELHIGQQNLSEVSDNVVIRDVSKVHEHPDYKPNENDIAVLVMRLPVEYSSTVIPICLDQNVDRDLRELEGERGWVTGWGKTENGILSEVLRTASLPVVKHLECLLNDRLLFGHVLNDNVFCAGNRNGTSPFPGDSGGGMYFNDGDRWILRGIIAFGKINELRVNDPLKFTMFVNIQWYMPWINEVFAESEPKQDKRQKRISELECERFQTLTRKRRNGDCFNNRFRHNVMLVNEKGDLECNGVLVEESHVVTTCKCIRSASHPVKVRIEANGDKAFAEINCHPKFVDNSKHYDLAILKLNAPVRLSNDLIPACLANNWTENLYDILVQTSHVTDARDATVVQDQNTLVESDENRITLYEVCKSLRGLGWYNRTDPSGELCVNNTDQLMYKSYVDLRSWKSSGAPLQTVSRRSCMSTVVGLKVYNEVSDNYPERSWVKVYARVAHDLDWIEQAVWNAKPKVDEPLPFDEEDIKCGYYHKEEEEDQWPWSVAILHRNPNTGEFRLTCSGTLISKKHVITMARCVMNQTTGRILPVDTFELHFGQFRLGKRHSQDQVRYVSEVHVHDESSADNLAILVTSFLVKMTRNVRHICLAAGHISEFWDKEYPAFITGWQTVDNGSPNKELLSSEILILKRQQCSEASLRLSANQHCAGYPHDEIRSVADHGSGLFYEPLISKLLRYAIWKLVGIVSSYEIGNHGERFTIVVNVQPYIPWIVGILTERKTERISEKECKRFSSLTKSDNGICDNMVARNDLLHVVTLHDDGPGIICPGVLVKEDRILTSCQCIRNPRQPTKAKIGNAEATAIMEMICHPDYNSSTFYHDIAAIKLSASVELSSHLVPACLANSWTENLEDAMIQTVLFKYKHRFDNHSSLRSKYDYVGSAEECDHVMPSRYKEHLLKPSQACVIHSELDVDLFNGSIVQSFDSRACRFTVVGIGSTAMDNPALSPVPKIGIVHRVAHYLDWIEQVVWDEWFLSEQNDDRSDSNYGHSTR